jgi:hypothetical protein
MRKRGAIALGIVLLLAACGGGTRAEPSNSAAVRPSTSAVLDIASPEAGAVVRGDQVDLVVDLEGATLTDVTSTDLRPDEGHLHVSLDDELVSMTSGLEQVLPGLAPGEHLLRVEFVANDHFPFEPRVLAAVSFRVKRR